MQSFKFQFFIIFFCNFYSCYNFKLDHLITEVGAMNIFIVLDKGNGQKELVTPPLDGGIILPGLKSN